METFRMSLGGDPKESDQAPKNAADQYRYRNDSGNRCCLHIILHGIKPYLSNEYIGKVCNYCANYFDIRDVLRQDG